MKVCWNWSCIDWIIQFVRDIKSQCQKVQIVAWAWRQGDRETSYVVVHRGVWFLLFTWNYSWNVVSIHMEFQARLKEGGWYVPSQQYQGCQTYTFTFFLTGICNRLLCLWASLLLRCFQMFTIICLYRCYPVDFRTFTPSSSLVEGSMQCATSALNRIFVRAKIVNIRWMLNMDHYPFHCFNIGLKQVPHQLHNKSDDCTSSITFSLDFTPANRKHNWN